jgi:hypothetical protein
MLIIGSTKPYADESTIPLRGRREGKTCMF